MRIWLVKTMKYAAAILILMISTYQLSIWQMSHKLQDDFKCKPILYMYQPSNVLVYLCKMVPWSG